MINYTKKAIKGAGYVSIMVGLASFLAYLFRIFLARNLSLSDYGLFWAIFTFMMFLLIFREIGLNSALTKYIAEYYGKKDYSKIKTLIISSFMFKLISSTLLICFFIFSARFLSIYYFKSSISYFILINLSLYIFLSLIVNHIHSILIGFQDVKWYTLSEPLRLGFALLFSLVLFQFDLGIMAPVFGFIIALVFTLFIISLGLLKYLFILKYTIKDFWKTTKLLFSFGLPVIFTGVGGKVISHFDVLLLTALVSLKEVGVYTAILPTALLFLFFSRAITMILFPMISELDEKKDLKRISAGMNLIYNYSFVFVIPMIISVFVYADFFITVLFGAEYVSGVFPFRILLIGVLGYIIAAINHSAISGIGKPFVVTQIILLSGLVNLILNIILIPLFNITGAAIATTFSYLLALFLSTYWLVKQIKLKSPWLNWLKLLGITLIFGFLIYFIQNILIINPILEIFISIGISIIVYIYLIFTLKIINLEHLKMIVKRVLN
ncbi:MAG: flippase [Nanoarchaeota archaeon]|nr:flippase [Nanoarchaeota archaeon]MBU1621989.1 flippase [Nanoarchaeota archaeon]